MFTATKNQFLERTHKTRFSSLKNNSKVFLSLQIFFTWDMLSHVGHEINFSYLCRSLPPPLVIVNLRWGCCRRQRIRLTAPIPEKFRLTCCVLPGHPPGSPGGDPPQKKLLWSRVDLEPMSKFFFVDANTWLTLLGIFSYFLAAFQYKCLLNAILF